MLRIVSGMVGRVFSMDANKYFWLSPKPCPKLSDEVMEGRMGVGLKEREEKLRWAKEIRKKNLKLIWKRIKMIFQGKNKKVAYGSSRFF